MQGIHTGVCRLIKEDHKASLKAEAMGKARTLRHPQAEVHYPLPAKAATAAQPASTTTRSKASVAGQQEAWPVQCQASPYRRRAVPGL